MTKTEGKADTGEVKVDANTTVSFLLRLTAGELAAVKQMASADLMSANNFIRKAVQIAIKSNTTTEVATRVRGTDGKFSKKEA